jgi:hypothetical protein
MKIFLIALVTGVFLFLIIPENVVAPLPFVIVPANGKGFKSTDTIESQSIQPPTISSTSPEVESGKSSGGTIGTPFTALSPPASLQQQQPKRFPVMPQCSSGFVVTTPLCHDNGLSSASSNAVNGSTLPSSRNNTGSTRGYLISCNQTSARVPTTADMGQTAMKITLPSSSNLALQGGEFLCDLIIPGSITTSNNIVTSTSAKDFASGYNFGKQDSTVGTRDPTSSCNPERGISNITACYYGYIQGYNKH